MLILSVLGVFIYFYRQKARKKRKKDAKKAAEIQLMQYIQENSK
jgi:hypothetical protein